MRYLLVARRLGGEAIRHEGATRKYRERDELGQPAAVQRSGEMMISVCGAWAALLPSAHMLGGALAP